MRYLIHLRPLASDDADRVLVWRNLPEIAIHMYGDHQISEAEHAAWIEATLHKEDARVWIVEWNGAPVGLASVNRIDPRSGRADWAFYLAEQQVRGQGIAVAVERLVVGWVFETRRLRKLWCEVLIENERVWRMHETFGFTREALLRAHIVKAGFPRDVVGLGMLAEEWPAARARADERLAERGFAPDALTIADL